MGSELLGLILTLFAGGGMGGSGGLNLVGLLNALSGSGAGSPQGGLEAIMQSQMQAVQRAFPFAPAQYTIDAAARSFLDSMGINPMSGFGQGLQSFIGSAYHLAPGVIGSMLGINDPKSFFSQISGSASAINHASGRGMITPFNPYSVMDAAGFTSEMGKLMYGFGTREDGGYNVEYSHGLTSEEMGKVAQRILSSRLTYVDDDTGARFDTASEEFGDRLKKLGSKINAAVSSLAKVTGSVDEAMSVMDRLAGGNFLGGTESQASDIANKAKRMAANMRIAAAISGVSASEMWQKQDLVETGAAMRFGVNPEIMRTSGLGTGVLMNSANASAAYGKWLVENPEANDMEKRRAWMAIQGRATQWFGSTAEQAISIVAANKEQFSEGDMGMIESLLMQGRSEDLKVLIRNRIGAEKFNTIMNNPGLIHANRLFADPDTYNALSVAGQEGNLFQSARRGARADLNMNVRNIDSQLGNATGNTESSYNQMESVRKGELVKMAVENGLTEEVANRYNAEELRNYLLRRPGIDALSISKREDSAVIEAQRQRIARSTMSEDEEDQARAQLLQALAEQPGIVTEKTRERLEAAIKDRNSDLDEVANSVLEAIGVREADRASFKRDLYGNKITRSQGARMTASLRKLGQYNNPEYTDEEIREAAEGFHRINIVKNSGKLYGAIADDNFESDKENIENFAGIVRNMRDEKVAFLAEGDDENLTDTFDKAASQMVSSAIGGRLGNLQGEELENMVNSVAADAMVRVRNGESWQEALSGALQSAGASRKGAIGSEGMAALGQIIKRVNDPNGKMGIRDLKALAYRVAIENSVTVGNAWDASEGGVELRKIANAPGAQTADGSYDTSAEANFTQKALEMQERGELMASAGDNENFSITKQAAAARTIAGLTGGLPEGVAGELAKKALESYYDPEGGHNLQESFADALEEASKSEEYDKATRAKLAEVSEKIRSGAEGYDVRRMWLNSAANILRDNTVYRNGGPEWRQRLEAVRLKKHGGQYAAQGGGNDINQVTLNALSAQAAAGIIPWEAYDAVVDALGAMDQEKADAQQNRVNNALAGHGEMEAETVASTMKTAAEIRKALGGHLNEHQIRAAAQGDDGAIKTIKEKLAAAGRTDVNHDLAIIAGMAKADDETGRTGAVLSPRSGMAALASGSAKKMRQLTGDTENPANLDYWSKVAKAAGRKQDPASFAVLDKLSTLIEAITDIGKKEPVPVKVIRTM